MATRTWTQDVHDRLELLYCAMGWDIEDIAHDLGKTPKAVQTQIRALGLRLTPQAVQARRERGLRSQRWDTPPDRVYTKLMRHYGKPPPKIRREAADAELRAMLKRLQDPEYVMQVIKRCQEHGLIPKDAA